MHFKNHFQKKLNCHAIFSGCLYRSLPRQLYLSIINRSRALAAAYPSFSFLEANILPLVLNILPLVLNILSLEVNGLLKH